MKRTICSLQFIMKLFSSCYIQEVALVSVYSLCHLIVCMTIHYKIITLPYHIHNPQTSVWSPNISALFVSTPVEICEQTKWFHECKREQRHIFTYATFGRENEDTCGNGRIGQCHNPSKTLSTISSSYCFSHVCVISHNTVIERETDYCIGLIPYIYIEYICVNGKLSFLIFPSH